MEHRKNPRTERSGLTLRPYTYGESLDSPPPEMTDDSGASDSDLESGEDMTDSAELLERMRAFQSSHEKGNKARSTPQTPGAATSEQLAAFDEMMFGSEHAVSDESTLVSENSEGSLSSAPDPLAVGGAETLPELGVSGVSDTGMRLSINCLGTLFFLNFVQAQAHYY